MKKTTRRFRPQRLLLFALAFCALFAALCVMFPTESNALTAGNYNVNMGIWVNRTGNDAWSAYIKIGYYQNNGNTKTLKETSDINITSECRNHGSSLFEYSYPVSGFPVYVKMWLKQNGNIFESNRGSLHLKSVNIGTQTVAGERNNASSTTIKDFSPGRNSTTTYTYRATGYTGTSADVTCSSWTFPTATSASISSQPSDVQIPKSGTQTTTFTATIKDKYGVIIGNTGLTRNTPSVSYTSGTSVSCTSTSGADADTYTVSVTNAAKLAGSTNTKSVTSTVSYTFNGGTATATTSSFTLTDPSYTVTFKDGDGNTFATQTVYYDDNATEPSGTPTKSYTSSLHYAFDSWSSIPTNVAEDKTVTSAYTSASHDAYLSWRAVNSSGTPTTNGTYCQQYCTVCGYIKQNAIAHNWNTTTSTYDGSTRNYTYNASQHWQQCTRCNVQNSKANHSTTYKWKTNGETTCEKYCTVCYRDMGSEGHNWATTSSTYDNQNHSYSHDGSQHWQTCTKCNQEVGRANHTTSYIWKSNNATNCTGFCTVCYRAMETSGHTWQTNTRTYTHTDLDGSTHSDSITKNYVINGATGHYQKCTKNGCAYQSANVAHTSYYKWRPNSATEHEEYCDICGYQPTLSAEEKAHDFVNIDDVPDNETLNTPDYHYCGICNRQVAHNYVNQVQMRHFNQVATCLHPATFFKSCDVCNRKHASATFNSGNCLQHVMVYHDPVPATCSSGGTLGYYTCDNACDNYKYADAGAQTIISDADFAANYTTPALKHIWSAVESSFGWGDEYADAFVTFKCDLCGTERVRHGAPIADYHAATYNSGAYTIYSVTITETENTDIPASFERTVRVNDVTEPPIQHEWNVKEWLWRSGNSSAVLVLRCENHDNEADYHEVTLNAVVTVTTTQPTHMQEGSVVYTAAISYAGTDYETAGSDVKTETIPALGHAYGTPVWGAWTGNDEDGWTMPSLTFTCPNCSEEGYSITKTPVMTTVTEKEATHFENGRVAYAASVEFGDTTYVTQKYVTILKGDHTFDAPTWTWTDDRSEATATFTCTVDHYYEAVVCSEPDVETTPATHVAPGQSVYSATVTHNGETFTTAGDNIKTVVLPATGHVYGDPVWTADVEPDADTDITVATATFTCACGEGDDCVVELTDNDIVINTKMPTHAKPGLKTYFAEVTFGGRTYTTSQWTAAIPAVGHTYGRPTWTWDGYGKATATFTCSCNEEDKEVTVEAIYGEGLGITRDTTYPTHTVDGKNVYTATVTFEGTEYTNTNPTEEVLPATGHTYVPMPEQFAFTFAEDPAETTAVFQLVCSSCQEEGFRKDEPAAVSVDATVAAGHENSGHVDYTATYTYDGTEYSDNATQNLPALGHAYGNPVWSWNEDHTAATATFTCQTCEGAALGEYGTFTLPFVEEGEEPQYAPVVTSSHTDPTCMTPGSDDYTATLDLSDEELDEVFANPDCAFAGESRVFTDVQTLPIEALGHNYGEPAWDFIENNTKATATFTCTRNCGEEGAVVTMDNLPVSAENTTPVTHDQNGLWTYTATVTFGDQTYTGQTTRVELAGGHVMEKHAADPATCVAPGTKEYYECTICHQKFKDSLGSQTYTDEQIIDPVGLNKHPNESRVTVQAVPSTCITHGNEKYIYCTLCGYLFNVKGVSVLSDTQKIPYDSEEAAALYTRQLSSNHTYDFEHPEDPVWNADHTACTMKLHCIHDATHDKRTLSASIIHVTDPGDCQHKSVTTYTASFSNAALPEEYRTVQVDVEGDFGPHSFTDYAHVTYPEEYGTEYYATVPCAIEGCTETQDVYALKSISSSGGSCTDNAILTYTFTFTDPNLTGTTKEVEGTTNNNHDYTIDPETVTYEWIGSDETGYEYVAYIPCTRDASHDKDVIHATITPSSTEGDCVTPATRIYAADFADELLTDPEPKVVTLTTNDNHDWTSELATSEVTAMPTQNEDGSWNDGVLTITCGRDGCGETKTEPIARADYSAYDAGMASLNTILTSDYIDAIKSQAQTAIEDNTIPQNLTVLDQASVTAKATALETANETIAAQIEAAGEEAHQLFTLTIRNTVDSTTRTVRQRAGTTYVLEAPIYERYSVQSWTATAGSISGNVYTFEQSDATVTAVYGSSLYKTGVFPDGTGHWESYPLDGGGYFVDLTVKAIKKVGGAVAGATVTLQKGDTVYTGVTNESGEYTFPEAITDGTYKTTVTAGGLVANSKIQVKSGRVSGNIGLLVEPVSDDNGGSTTVNLSFFQRIIQWFRNLFSKIFKR